MKIVAKPIQMILWQKEKGYPQPIKFRLQKEDLSYQVIRIDRINEVFFEQKAGTDSLVYRCQSSLGQLEKTYELKFIIPEYRWLLYKI